MEGRKLYIIGARADGGEGVHWLCTVDGMVLGSFEAEGIAVAHLAVPPDLTREGDQVTTLLPGDPLIDTIVGRNYMLSRWNR